MKRLFLLTILSFLTLSVSATECTNYLTNDYKNEFGIKVKIKSKTEQTSVYQQKMGNVYASSMIYGYGYLKRPKFRKSDITYKCILDSNNNVLWGDIFFVND